MLDTLIHQKTALLADVAKRIVVKNVILGEESGYEEKHTIKSDAPRTVDYRANIQDIAKYLLILMKDAELRETMGLKGRERAVANFDYRVVAQKFVKIVQDRLGIK